MKEHACDVIGGVLSGKIDRGRGAVALQGLNTLARIVDLERRILETGELLDRLERDASGTRGLWR